MRQQKRTLRPAMTLLPSQCRAARALLGLGQRELAKLANLGVKTIVEFEGDRRTVHPNNISAIRTSLESSGVEFLENGDGPGVRLRKLKPVAEPVKKPKRKT